MATTSPFTQKYGARVPAAAQAASAGAAITISPVRGVVTGVTYATDTTLTGANTNTRKVSLINKGQDGSGTTVVATLQFNSGVNATAFDEKAITLSATPANLVVAEGDVLAWQSDAVSSGLADPGGLVTISLARTTGR